MKSVICIVGLALVAHYVMAGPARRRKTQCQSPNYSSFVAQSQAIFDTSKGAYTKQDVRIVKIRGRDLVRSLGWMTVTQRVEYFSYTNV